MPVLQFLRARSTEGCAVGWALFVLNIAVFEIAKKNMLKKFFAFFVASVMCFGVMTLASCGSSSSDEEIEKEYNKAVEEFEDAVDDAVNEAASELENIDF